MSKKSLWRVRDKLQVHLKWKNLGKKGNLGFQGVSEDEPKEAIFGCRKDFLLVVMLRKHKELAVFNSYENLETKLES